MLRTVGLCGMLAACTQPAAIPPVLHDEVAHTLDAARAAQAPTVVIYHAAWCAACRALMQHWSHPKVAAAVARGRIRLVRVELGAEGHALIAAPEAFTPEAQAVTSIPTLQAVDRRGAPMAGRRLLGAAGPERLAAWLDEVAQVP